MPNDKGLLKKELYQDQAKLIDAICKERDVALKKLLQESLDMINNAKSGHPGIALSAAPMLYSLFANMLTVPFMAIISFCGFISSILALIPVIGTKICFLLDKINEPFLTFVYFIAEKFSSNN